MKCDFGKFIVLGLALISVTCIIAEETAGDVYEDGYYDDGYEDSISAVEVSVDSVMTNAPESFFGFHKIAGGGAIQISKMLVNEKYLNQTVDMYDCVKREEAHILAVEEVEEEEEEPEITKQVNDLRKKMEEVSILAGHIANGTLPVDMNATANATEVKEKKKEKKISFREKQEAKMKERRERELQREKLRPKFRLGADCESLVCGSCKAVVEEFGRSALAVVDDGKYRYVEDVLTVGSGFCKSKSIALKYVDMVGHICATFEQESLGYKEALVSAFESPPKGDWRSIATWENLNAKKKQVCMAVGACAAEDFHFQTKAVLRVQEQWDDKCFTCQAFAKELESKVQLSRHVTEGSIVPIVAETCNRIDLEPYYQDICKPLVQGKLLDDIAWLAKVHGESIDRKAKGEVRFPDKLCEEINWCEPWVDPVKLREKQAQESMEAVFF